MSEITVSEFTVSEITFSEVAMSEFTVSDATVNEVTVSEATMMNHMVEMRVGSTNNKSTLLWKALKQRAKLVHAFKFMCDLLVCAGVWCEYTKSHTHAHTHTHIHTHTRAHTHTNTP